MWPTRTTRRTCGPSETGWATPSITRAWAWMRRCFMRSADLTSGGGGRPRTPRPMSDRRVALCVATFYEELAQRLEDGARAALAEQGVEEIDRFQVPGAF